MPEKIAYPLWSAIGVAVCDVFIESIVFHATNIALHHAEPSTGFNQAQFLDQLKELQEEGVCSTTREGEEYYFK